MNERAQEIASGLPPDLDSLPRLKGFRLRGIAMTRLETFIDAAFAFAITMLVIATQQIPDDIETLLAAFRNVPAFVASIIVLGIFWRDHWLWSRRYGLEDGVSIFISWAMIVTMLIYIYPLKAIFSSMWFLLSGGRVGHILGAHSESQVRALFAIFALGFTAIALEMLLLNLHGSPLSFMGSTPAVAILSVLAVGELVADKLPMIPKRIAPAPLMARVVTGGLCGACLCAAVEKSLLAGTLLGGIGGIVGAF